MRYLATWILVLALAASAAASDNIVIVFDTSGSMGYKMRRANNRSRMEVAQAALLKVLSKLPNTTNVGIVTFGGWVYDLDKIDQAKLQAAIQNCNPSGSTPLYRYIVTGANRLLEERERQNNVGYYKLLVVTDGEAQDNDLNLDGQFKDGSFRPGVLKDVIGRGIVVDTIALEMAKDHLLRSQINGTYMRGDDPDMLEQSLRQAVAEVGYSAKDGLTDEQFAEIDLPEDFARHVITGLTKFRNYPIGTQEPVKVMVNGVETIMDPAAPTSNSENLWIGGMIAVIGVVLLVGICLLCKL